MSEQTEPQTWPTYRLNFARTGTPSSTAHRSVSKARWTFRSSNGARSAPALVEGVLYFGDMAGKFYALDAASGDMLWNVDTKAPIFSAPAVARHLGYFGSAYGKVYPRKR